VLDKANPFYREIKTVIKVTRAEATIAWFCSGKRQFLIKNEVRFPVYADGIYDCTKKLQQAINCGGAYLPSGKYSTGKILIKNGGNITGESHEESRITWRDA
jgi:hypothetical protein